jgi:hypothetical protein
MARKEDNLVKGDEAHKFTPEEASKGGKASAEARRKKRDLRLAMEMLLEQDITGKDGTVKSGAEAIAVQQFKKALKGDSKAFEIIRDTSGQSVVQKIAVAEVDADVISEVERMVMDESE